MDSLSIQTSLTILEDRFRELREIGETRVASWEKEKAEALQRVEELEREVAVESKGKVEALQRVEELEREMAVESKGKVEALQRVEELEREVVAVRADTELALLQLHQVQEELERYFLLSRQQDDMLSSSENLTRRAVAALISKMAQ